jgi:Ca2+-binding RTX toxin-like protein
VLEAGSAVENLTTNNQALSGAIDITGNELINIIVGNAGANILDGGGGADTLQGLGGNDRYYIDNAADQVLEVAAGGDDILLTSVDYVLAAAALVESLTTRNQAGFDAIDIIGNDIANVIVGNAGANVLQGLGGDDLLQGLGGADVFFGGLGNDRLFGGAGADQYGFDSPLNAATNVDELEDFVVVDDIVVLDRSIFTGIAANGTLAAGAFRLGAAAGDADDRIVYNSATGQIFYDADGSGATAQILFATIAPATALTNLDFSAIA